MDIKKRISFYLQKVRDNEEHQVKIRISWNGKYLQLASGYSFSKDKWDEDNERCKRNTSNLKGYSAADVNKRLNKLEDIAESIFKTFEVNDIMPTVEEYKDAFNIADGRKTVEERNLSLNKYLLDFQKDQGSVNSWSDGTYYKFNTLSKHLKGFDSELKINDFTNKKLISFIEYLRDECDLQNTTILKNWKLLSWFLRWADKNGYLKCKDYVNFKPGLKTVKDKEIIFLDWNELMKVYNFQFPENKQYLSKARDLFCFECFTSLRYSDIAKLQRTDISNDTIKIVTKKTNDSIDIELNKYSRAILEKYKDDEQPLPMISNQKLNVYIKEACFIIGIDEPIKTTYYKGSERIEEVHPKYELIGTHTGRRTFICNALMLGIPPAVVMAWTGHSDYKAMKPYIKIADSAKRNEMSKFDK